MPIRNNINSSISAFLGGFGSKSRGFGSMPVLPLQSPIPRVGVQPPSAQASPSGQNVGGAGGGAFSNFFRSLGLGVSTALAAGINRYVDRKSGGLSTDARVTDARRDQPMFQIPVQHSVQFTTQQKLLAGGVLAALLLVVVAKN